VFAYNNGATYTLGALVQRVAGQSLTAYLQPRLFDPLGIAPPFWHAHPAGRELGFSGLHLTTEAIARFGQLYLDDGVWQGERLLPEGWVAEASRLHTPNPDEPNPDWQQGYGYQLWRSRHGYRGDGAYGQFCLVLPEHDAVLVTTAQTEDMQGILDAVWAHVLPALATTTPEQDGALARRLRALILPPEGAGRGAGPLGEQPEVTVPELVDEPGGWRLGLADGGRPLTLRCGNGVWQQNTLTVADGRRLDVAASARAEAEHLVVQLAFVQTPHRLELTVDRQTSAATARWWSTPLHARHLADLAISQG